MYKPILFSTEMVWAISENRKTQTRRIAKHSKKPQAKTGEIFWVRETWQNTDFLGISSEDFGFIYKASENGRDWEENTIGWKWKPSIFMPKKACRFFLEITSVKLERITDITEKDAIKEGIQDLKNPIYSFKNLWCSTYSEPFWDEKIWVWVYEFKKINAPNNFH